MSKLGQRFKNTIKFLVVVFGALLMSVGIIYAATTIGTNITTTGTTTLGDGTGDTVTINGHIAAATTTGNLVVGVSTLATPTSSLSVFGGLHVFNGVATSSEALWVGSAGTVNNLNLTGGDLYVQDGLEVDGGSWLNSATTTDSLVIGGYASTTGDLIVNGGTIDNTTSTATTTQGIFAITRTGGKATSTLGVGDMNDAVGRSTGCLEMVTSAGTYVRAIIDGTAWNIAAGRCVPQ